MSKTYQCPRQRIDYGQLSPPGCQCPDCGSPLELREPMTVRHKRALWGPMGVYGAVEVEAIPPVEEGYRIPDAEIEKIRRAIKEELGVETDVLTSDDLTTERIRGLDFEERVKS